MHYGHGAAFPPLLVEENMQFKALWARCRFFGPDVDLPSLLVEENLRFKVLWF